MGSPAGFSSSSSDDQVRVHQFIRQYGRAPSAAELALYKESTRSASRRRLSVRLALARAVARHGKHNAARHQQQA